MIEVTYLVFIRAIGSIAPHHVCAQEEGAVAYYRSTDGVLIGRVRANGKFEILESLIRD